MFPGCSRAEIFAPQHKAARAPAEMEDNMNEVMDTFSKPLSTTARSSSSEEIVKSFFPTVPVARTSEDDGKL